MHDVRTVPETHRHESLFSQCAAHATLLPIHRLVRGTGDMTCADVFLTQPEPAHQHADYHVAFVLGGSGQHEDAGGRLPILAGDVCIVVPGQWHAYPRVHGTLSLFTVTLAPAYLATIAPLLGNPFWLGSPPLKEHDDRPGPSHIRLSQFELHRVWPLLMALREEAGNGEAHGRSAVRAGLLLQVLGSLDGDHRHRHRATDRKDEQGDTGLVVAIQYLEERYVGPITVRELAEQSGYTPTSLTRKFRQRLGMSPSEYLLNLRVQRACALLRETGLSISSIAGAVGFRDSHYFATRFHQVMGMTPSAFRMQSKIDSRTA